ncbi:DUF732 domain-containing protein [Mycobacterium sp. ST-F2]|uniref:DUF732 domain-containing protein n=1 Tax=Mycobacterium sp. ST-F2 TaxID=1490484 RepID=UPI00114EEB8F|nr:DUF732 domain-containing protein [Mycobacterium sp. ST-F2]
MKATKLLAAGVALSAPLVLAPSAVALPPGCDWNTDAGVQACMGGGPMDAGKNGNGDTYGPTGEAGFLREVRLVAWSASVLSDQQVIDAGHWVCNQRRQDRSQKNVVMSLQAAFFKKGITDSDSAYIEDNAEMYLCPGLPGR